MRLLVINSNLSPKPYLAPFSQNTSVIDSQTDRQWGQTTTVPKSLYGIAVARGENLDRMPWALLTVKFVCKLSCVLDGLTTMNKFSAPRINIL